jgi:IS5 family transposase
MPRYQLLPTLWSLPQCDLCRLDLSYARQFSLLSALWHSLEWTKVDRPKSDPELLAEEKRQFLDDQRQRNDVEGKIGQGERRVGLGLIREKLAVTQDSTIVLNVLVMNPEKLLALLFVFTSALLHILLVNKGGQSVRNLSMKPQMAAAS